MPNDSYVVAVTGATGMIGRAIVQRLTSTGYTVRRLTRSQPSLGEIAWDPARGTIDQAGLEGIDAVVHLAGERIDQRWSDERKREIRQSRERGTALIARTLAALERPPHVLVSMSAIGIYGSRGDEVLDERSTRGRGFLADVVDAWEKSADPARDAGIRVVHPRTGVVMNPAGGALARLLPIFKLGGGGKIGDGKHWMSWVALTDVVNAYETFLTTDGLAGPFDVTSPNPVTNAEFSRVLAHVLHRPAIATVPEFALKLMYGEMGEETVLASQRVLPRRLEEAGFRFEYPDLEAALRHELALPA
jgi:uncharacterized protein